jgi:hypothetical protein
MSKPDQHHDLRFALIATGTLESSWVVAQLAWCRPLRRTFLGVNIADKTYSLASRPMHHVFTCCACLTQVLSAHYPVIALWVGCIPIGISAAIFLANLFLA